MWLEHFAGLAAGNLYKWRKAYCSGCLFTHRPQTVVCLFLWNPLTIYHFKISLFHCLPRLLDPHWPWFRHFNLLWPVPLPRFGPHFSKSMDISTLEDSQVLSAFPYDIRFLDLSPEDANDFGLNPLLPVQSSLGIHATVMDSADRAGLDPLDFGKGGKSRRESSKGKGKKGQRQRQRQGSHECSPLQRKERWSGWPGRLAWWHAWPLLVEKLEQQQMVYKRWFHTKSRPQVFRLQMGQGSAAQTLMLRWSAVCVLPATGSWGLT